MTRKNRIRIGAVAVGLGAAPLSTLWTSRHDLSIGPMLLIAVSVPLQAGAWMALVFLHTRWMPHIVMMLVAGAVSTATWYGYAKAAGTALFDPQHKQHEVYIPLAGFTAVYLFGLLVLTSWKSVE